MLEMQLLGIKQAILDKYQQNHQHRLLHIIGVADMALKLAEQYNVDKMKAYIAALLHDYYKYESLEEMLELIDDEDKEYCKENQYLAHAYASANSLIREFEIDDKEIYDAIKNHVVGRCNMSMLEKILFISDFTELNRTSEICLLVRDELFMRGIDEAIYLATLKSIEKNMDTVNPIQIDVLNEYKEKIK